MIEFKGEQDDLSMLLVSAIRYALGRRTYIVDWTVDTVINNLDNLTEKDRHVMMRDIKGQKDYGDECDKQDWLRLFAILEAKE